MIEKASEKDIEEIRKILLREFPYKESGREKIAEKIRNPEIYVFKKIVNEETAGFVEIEFIDSNARINAVTVKEGHRRMGFGKELLLHAVNFAKKHGAKKATLLVKTENIAAKKLYESLGFEFKKLHDKKIWGSVIEVWEKRLAEKEAGYLN